MSFIVSQEAARRLLMDEAGNYKQDDESIFLCKVVTDNDTKGEHNNIEVLSLD